MSKKPPGDKGPMGAEAHTDKGAPDTTDAAGKKTDADLQEDLKESFPGSDAPTDTRRTKDEK